MMNGETRKYAIVTGASSGIGYELARCCAKNNYDLLIVADEQEIYDAAEMLSAYDVEIEAMVADLSTMAGVMQIVNRVGGYDPDLLLRCLRHQAGPIPPRAGNVAMDSSKLARHLGDDLFQPWPFDTRLVPTDREWHHDRRLPIGTRRDLERLLYAPTEF